MILPEMRDTLIVLLLVTVATLGYFVTNQQRRIKSLEARPKTNTIELQEKCAKQAELVFKQSGWEAKDVIAEFSNHYNSKLNRCFMRVEKTDPTIVTKTIFTTKFVFDAFERKSYAEYTWKTEPGKKYWEVAPTECAVTLADGTRKMCRSSDEFDELVKPYMDQ